MIGRELTLFREHAFVTHMLPWCTSSCSSTSPRPLLRIIGWIWGERWCSWWQDRCQCWPCGWPASSLHRCSGNIGSRRMRMFLLRGHEIICVCGPGSVPCHTSRVTMTRISRWIWGLSWDLRLRLTVCDRGWMVGAVLEGCRLLLARLRRRISVRHCWQSHFQGPNSKIGARI